MGLYSAVSELWKRPKQGLGDLWQQRQVKWRKEPTIIKIERPTRIDRARGLGYKAKEGYIVARVRVSRGGRQRPLIKKGRRSKHRRRTKIVDKSYQRVAEEKVQRRFANLEILNSYYVGKDGIHYWYEVILVDPYSPVIKADPKINWICGRQHTKRVFRGKTSAGRHGRGLIHKGKGAEKLRPSLNAHKGRGK